MKTGCGKNDGNPFYVEDTTGLGLIERVDDTIETGFIDYGTPVGDEYEVNYTLAERTRQSSRWL